jgi:hypothetical protein
LIMNELKPGILFGMNNANKNTNTQY